MANEPPTDEEVDDPIPPHQVDQATEYTIYWTLRVQPIRREAFTGAFTKARQRILQPWLDARGLKLGPVLRPVAMAFRDTTPPPGTLRTHWATSSVFPSVRSRSFISERLWRPPLPSTDTLATGKESPTPLGLQPMLISSYRYRGEPPTRS